jgi:hypothetical protein
VCNEAERNHTVEDEVVKKISHHKSSHRAGIPVLVLLSASFSDI